MLSDQISIVLSAPLPFALGSFAVVIPICALIWWAMQRAYRKNIDAKQSMYEQAAQQAKISQWATAKLRKAMADLEATTAEVKDKDPELAAQMSKNLHLANVQLDNITSTNNAINFWLRGLPERNRKRNWGLTRKSNSDG